MLLFKARYSAAASWSVHAIAVFPLSGVFFFAGLRCEQIPISPSWGQRRPSDGCRTRRVVAVPVLPLFQRHRPQVMQPNIRSMQIRLPYTYSNKHLGAYKLSVIRVRRWLVYTYDASISTSMRHVWTSTRRKNKTEESVPLSCLRKSCLRHSGLHMAYACACVVHVNQPSIEGGAKTGKRSIGSWGENKSLRHCVLEVYAFVNCGNEKEMSSSKNNIDFWLPETKVPLNSPFG